MNEYRKGTTKAYDEGVGAASAAAYQSNVWTEVMDTLDRLRTLLKDLEWADTDYSDDPVPFPLPLCPLCKKMKCDGHADDCRLAREVKDA